MTEIIMLMFENNLELGIINEDIITIETNDNLYTEKIEKQHEILNIRDEQYYEYEDVKYPHSYFKNNYESYILFFEDKLQTFFKIDNVLFNLKNKYECLIVNEILILKIEKILVFYYKNEENIYFIKKTPDNFDLVKYIDYTNIKFENWLDALRHYMIYNYDCDYLNIENIIFLGKFNIACFNYSHMYVIIDNNYHKFYVDNDSIFIDTTAFTLHNNNICFTSTIHNYISFIKHKHVLIER
jgi:hypothetical protein